MDHSPTSHQQAGNYKWYVLTMLTIVYVFAFIDRQLIIILQESIKEDMGLTDAQLGFITGLAFSVMYVLVVIPIARLADHYSRKNIVTISLSVWSVITALTGMAGNYIQLVIARAGVGMGEAGAVPASHSIIADYFPQEQRSKAYAIHGIGLYIGLLIGFALGGVLEEYYGWRTAFYVIGIPGLIFSVLFYFSVKEPVRQLSPIDDANITEPPSTMEVLKFLISKKTFIYLALAAVLHSFVGSAYSSWMPPLLSRVYGMGTVEIGLWLAFAIGVCGAGGTYAGGYLGDKLGKRDIRWQLWLPAISILLSIPFAFLMLLSTQKYVTLYAYLMPNILYAVFLGPTYALVQSLVGSRMRAIASAIVLVLISFFGMGMGPYVTGLLSDLLTPSFGDEAIKRSLLIIGGFDLIAAYFFYKASITLLGDNL